MGTRVVVLNCASYVDFYLDCTVHDEVLPFPFMQLNLQAKRAAEAKQAADELIASGNNNNADNNENNTAVSPEGTPPRHAPTTTSTSTTSSQQAEVQRNQNFSAAAPISTKSQPTTTEAEAESREFMLQLERELIATGTNFDTNSLSKGCTDTLTSTGEHDALQAFDLEAAAISSGRNNNNDRRSSGTNANQTTSDVLKFLNIQEAELSENAKPGKGNKGQMKTNARRFFP